MCHLSLHLMHTWQPCCTMTLPFSTFLLWTYSTRPSSIFWWPRTVGVTWLEILMSWRIKMTHSQGKEGYISVISIFICYQYLQVALELHYFPTTPKYPWAPKFSSYPRTCLHTEIPVHIHSRILYSSRQLYMNRVKNKQITYSHRINRQFLINHKIGAQTTHFSGPT